MPCLLIEFRALCKLCLWWCGHFISLLSPSGSTLPMAPATVEPQEGQGLPNVLCGLTQRPGVLPPWASTTTDPQHRPPGMWRHMLGVAPYRSSPHTKLRDCVWAPVGSSPSPTATPHPVLPSLPFWAAGRKECSLHCEHRLCGVWGGGGAQERFAEWIKKMNEGMSEWMNKYIHFYYSSQYSKWPRMHKIVKKKGLSLYLKLHKESMLNP